MKTRTIASAVAVALVAPAAMAQTANPVTLYGRIFGSIQSVEATGSSPVSRRTRVEDESSLFGVRGIESLGGGLQAFFQLESVFRIDSNNSTFAARNSGVGLQGGFGSVLIGRWDSPYKYATYAADPWVLLTLAGDNNTVQDQGNFGRRPQNVLQYWTPTLGGFSARLAATANEGKTANANPRDASVSAGWAGTHASISLSWEKHYDQLLAAPTPGVNEEGLMLVGSFSFGKTKIGYIAEQIKKTGRTKQKNYYLSIDQTLYGPHALVATVGRSRDGDPVSQAVQPETKTYSAAYRYTFSKRTMVYAMYAAINNNSVGTKNFPYYAIPGTGPGSDPRGYAIGMRHLF